MDFALTVTPTVTVVAIRATGCPHRTVLPVPFTSFSARPALPPAYSVGVKSNPIEKEKTNGKQTEHSS